MSIQINEIKIKEKAGINRKTSKNSLSWMNRDIILFGSKFNDKKKESFYSELGMLLSSGIDIKSALEIILNEQRNTSDKSLLNKIYLNVIEGDSLSDSLEKKIIFTPYEVNSIRIGEETGKLNNVLNDLTNFFGKKIKQKRQLVNAFSYPVIVMMTAFAALYFMMNFMVPMFVDIFNRFHGKLPDLTLLIINISKFFSDNILYFILIVSIITIYLYFNKNEKWFRSLSSKVLLNLPIFGRIVKLVYLERFFQSMTLLTGSKTPLLRSIALVKDMIDFYQFEIALEKVKKEILLGKSLNECLSEFDLLFDIKIISLIKVGEETNQLHKIFDKLNKQYNEELEHRISMISSLLEPVIIVLVGLLVGIILIAMYLPLFQMSTSIV